MKTIYLAGGCFWGTQKFLDQFEGVIETEVGYANGDEATAHVAPSYEQVCDGSGHAETVKVVYDESQLTTERLLGFYFLSIDPTAVNHQGGDYGVQYRTGIYYEDETLLPEIQRVIAQEADQLKAQGKTLAVEVLPLRHFYGAEEYHQKYLDKNPFGYCHIRPELFRLGTGEEIDNLG